VTGSTPFFLRVTERNGADDIEIEIRAASN